MPVPSHISKEHVSELACTFAALILYDLKTDIDANKIKSIITAANVQVEPFWPSVFAKYLQGKDVGSLLLNIGGGSTGGAPAAATGGASADSGAAAEEKKEESESEEESDEDAFGGLF
jgi:large subunit ribosomal protein LP1